MKEVWRTVPSLPAYMASSLGRVRCVAHRKPMPYGGYRWYGGKAIRGQWSKGTGGGRYIIVYKGHTYKVAQMVCEAFKGRKPFKRAVAMHADENSRHNRPGNLSWGTQKQNLNHPKFLAYCAKACARKMRGLSPTS